VDAPPPARRLVRMDPAAPAGPSLELPALPPVKAPDPAATALTADEAKAATAYIRVGGGERMSTGSGFLVAKTGGGGLVATNRHVVEDALGTSGDARETPPAVTVVFHSNVAGKEVSVPATIVAVHPDADLAVLRVPGGKLPAKPIDPFAAPPVDTGTAVQILGFPLGEHLARSGANPDISVSPGSVSSLRRDREGKLEQVQITGPLIFGNSGGPIVDKDGRLVGVAVSTLLGTGLGFAVPAAELSDLLAGKFLPAGVVPEALDDKTARFKVAVPFIDPAGRVKGVRLLYRAKGPRPDPAKDPATGYKLLDGADRLDLALAGEGPDRRRAATGELALPAGTTEAVLQLVAEAAGGAVVASPPVAFTLAPGDVASGRDAGSLSDFLAKVKADPAGMEGKPGVVRGKVLAMVPSLAPHQDIAVAGPDGKQPDGFRFLVDREVAAQFDELTKEQEGLDARLVLVPGFKGFDDRVRVRVARVDYLDRFDRPVKTIPGEPPADELARLNRDPDRLADKPLVVTAAAVFEFDRTGAEGDHLPVVFPSHRSPRNLRFSTLPQLTQKLAQERFRPYAVYRVRLTVTPVARRDKSTPAPVMVRKIEVLDKGGKVMKTFE
ncbi:MAG: serine protease, partial [Gemmataceae bacterium]|nr:serine protease [Gemmataceae bacterium]